jgi:hypothetical protein
MVLSLNIKQGEDWFKRFVWKQGGVPVYLNLANASATVKSVDGNHIYDASDTRFNEMKGVVDVFLVKDITKDMPIGPYLLQIHLEFLNGFTQSTDCIPLQVTRCNFERPTSWG